MSTDRLPLNRAARKRQDGTLNKWSKQVLAIKISIQSKRLYFGVFLRFIRYINLHVYMHDAILFLQKKLNKY